MRCLGLGGADEAAGISGYSRRCGGLACCGRKRNSPSACATLACSTPSDRTTRRRKHGSQCSSKLFEQLGWVVGRNLKIEIRQVGDDVDSLRSDAVELVALAPDVIVTIGSVAIAPLQQATRTIPIVFVNAPDPVGAGFVQSMAHPGGNITGFSNFEYSMSGKWAELLKQIAPNVTRALVVRDPTSAAGIGQFAAVRSVAQSLGVELTPVDVRDTDEIEQT